MQYKFRKANKLEKRITADVAHLLVATIALALGISENEINQVALNTGYRLLNGTILVLKGGSRWVLRVSSFSYKDLAFNIVSILSLYTSELNKRARSLYPKERIIGQVTTFWKDNGVTTVHWPNEKVYNSSPDAPPSERWKPFLGRPILAEERTWDDSFIGALETIGKQLEQLGYRVKYNEPKVDNFPDKVRTTMYINAYDDNRRKEVP